MPKEKVMYINLPEGAYYQRVEVTEDGKIGIIYTEQDVSNEKPIKAPLIVSIPKPIPLIGGTEVYQKNNGTPYWYCKIKEGRDEFMHLYFKDLTEYDLLYDKNGKKRKFIKEKQKKFRENVLEALKNKPKEGYRWIPVFEPSMDSNGYLQYVSGARVLIGKIHDSYGWEKKIKEYSPANGSRIASITTYFLLALRWLKDGVATLKQLADDSKDIGHYCNSKGTKKHFEETGEREFGGLFGFVGNTYKIVKDSAACSSFSTVGGYCGNYGDEYPMANVKFVECPYDRKNYGVGFLELTK